MTAGVRVDKWLWAVRVFKTRSLATQACTGGLVKVNDRAVKAAHKVVVGDRVEVSGVVRLSHLEVAGLVEKRLGAARAAECYVDHSPPPPPREQVPQYARRDRGAGRPTKRDRRAIDRLRRG